MLIQVITCTALLFIGVWLYVFAFNFSKIIEGLLIALIDTDYNKMHSERAECSTQCDPIHKCYKVFYDHPSIVV